MGADRGGAFGYLGDTQTGKTTLAAIHAWEHVERTARPLCVLDATCAWNFQAAPPHVDNAAELVEEVWGKRRHAAFVVEELDDVEDVCRRVRDSVITLKKKHGLEKAIRAAGCVLLIDEASFWMKASKCPVPIRRAVRTWAHYGGIVLFVTQRPSDLHGDVWTANPLLHVCRTTGRLDLDVMEEEFDVPRDLLPSLHPHDESDPVKEYVVIRNRRLEMRDGKPVIRQVPPPHA